MMEARIASTQVIVAAVKPRFLGVVAFALSTALSSCSMFQGINDYDVAGGIAKEKYQSLEGRKAPAPQERGEEPPIPDFQSVLAAPTAPDLADTRRVSIAVTEAVPVRDVLIELARKSQVDLEMDPRVSGGVIMTATDRPLLEVVDRLVDLAELRYKFERNTLKVEVDDPYLEQYHMDVLNVTRNGTSSASSSTDATTVAQSIGTGGGGGGGNNKSATTIDTTSKSDFWTTIGTGVAQILEGVQSRRNPATGIEANYIPEASGPVAARPATAPKGGAAAPGAAAVAPGAAQLQAANQIARGQQQAAAALAAPATAAGDQPGLAELHVSGGAGVTTNFSSRYSLNPEAGIITVYANQRQQKAVERYLRDVRNSISQQVLIEAKVLEITLNDNYRAGVDWSAILGPNSNTQNVRINTNFGQSLPSQLITPDLAATWAGAILSPNGRNNLSIAAQLMSQFGTVRTLSSPRLTVLNNQMAQLKVAQNQVFFQLQVNVTQGTPTTPPLTTVNSQIKTVPVGLIMSVQPAVDSVSRRISLNLRPSITRITSFVNDPGVAVSIAVAQQNNPNANIPAVTSAIPVIEVREMDSMVNMDSGQTLVMGGLMQENASLTREGVPGLMDVPVIGRAASQNSRLVTTSELIIFIRASVVSAPGSVSDEDIRLYKTYTPDPRPVAF